MDELNPIFLRSFPVGIGAANSAAGGRRSSLLPAFRPADGGDVFRPGQLWKNRAAAGDGALSTGCRCGNCSQCAAAAYARQGQQAGAENLAVTGAESSGGRKSTEEGSGGEAGEVAETDAAMATTRSRGVDGEPLDPREAAVLMELKKADAAVRAHEQAHLAAAGGLAKGAANFSYREGPDGRRYAVAGEVSIDTSKGATPEETISRMARVRAAALAPADPSPQDRKVAQAAAVTMGEARVELRMDRGEREAAGAVEDDAAAGERRQGTDGVTSTEPTETAAPSVAMRGYSAIASFGREQGDFHRLV